jgi:hypothetical protein
VERCHIPELMNAINILSERSKLQGNETLHWPTSDTYVNQHTALCARCGGNSSGTRFWSCAARPAELPRAWDKKGCQGVGERGLLAHSAVLA